MTAAILILVGLVGLLLTLRYRNRVRRCHCGKPSYAVTAKECSLCAECLEKLARGVMEDLEYEDNFRDREPN